MLVTSNGQKPKEHREGLNGLLSMDDGSVQPVVDWGMYHVDPRIESEVYKRLRADLLKSSLSKVYHPMMIMCISIVIF